MSAIYCLLVWALESIYKFQERMGEDKEKPCKM
jgi:hypothetical protein